MFLCKREENDSHLKLPFDLVSVVLKSGSSLHGLILCLQGTFLLSKNLLVSLLKSLTSIKMKGKTLLKELNS